MVEKVACIVLTPGQTADVTIVQIYDCCNAIYATTCKVVAVQDMHGVEDHGLH